MGFLFTDIVGYTSMVSTWDARRVLVLLHNYFTRVDAAVHALKLFKASQGWLRMGVVARQHQCGSVVQGDGC